VLAYKSHQRSIRDKKWKLIKFPLINRTELYDLEEDPHETTNLVEDSEYSDTVERLTALLETECRAYGDVLPLVSDNPKPERFNPPKERIKAGYPGGLAPLDRSFWWD
jgi:arylsulfatase A-like enzyme